MAFAMVLLLDDDSEDEREEERLIQSIKERRVRIYKMHIDGKLREFRTLYGDNIYKLDPLFKNDKELIGLTVISDDYKTYEWICQQEISWIYNYMVIDHIAKHYNLYNNKLECAVRYDKNQCHCNIF